MKRPTRIAFAFASLLPIAACGGVALDDEGEAPVEKTGTSSDALRKLAAAEIVGTLAYGQTSEPVPYVATPTYRAFRFVGQKGDKVEARVSNPAGDAVAWILDGTFKTIATNDDADDSTRDAFVTVKLPAAGTYYVAFRDYDGEPGTFVVALDKAGVPSPDGGPVEAGASDAGTTDVADASVLDVATADAATVDATTADAATADAATADAAIDAGPAVLGPACDERLTDLGLATIATTHPRSIGGTYGTVISNGGTVLGTYNTWLFKRTCDPNELVCTPWVDQRLDGRFTTEYPQQVPSYAWTRQGNVVLYGSASPFSLAFLSGQEKTGYAEGLGYLVRSGSLATVTKMNWTTDHTGRTLPDYFVPHPAYAPLSGRVGDHCLRFEGTNKVPNGIAVDEYTVVLFSSWP